MMSNSSRTSTPSTFSMAVSDYQGSSENEANKMVARQQQTAIGLAGAKDSTRRKTLLTFIDKLGHLGVHQDIGLPIIAAIGDQSVGKSSVVEAITGVRLPRANQTCTRCPTECLIKHSNDPWKCNISIYFVDKNYIKFGDTIYNPDEVTERVRRAQRAILNPSAPDPLVYLDNAANVSDKNEIGFSRSYISIQISGPDLVDLSFVDLPGIIHSETEGEDPNNVPLIKDLTVKYIEKKSCLILLTVSCANDLENQIASKLAKEHDKEGERTIGVLTKPDVVGRGDEHIWVKRVKNEDKGRNLKLGWHVVRLPSTEQLETNITRKAASEEEKKFFETSPTQWSRLSMHADNVGIEKLVTSLSHTLSALIAERMPQLQTELQEILMDTEKQLSTLPPAPPENAQAAMTTLIMSFSDDVKCLVNGQPGKSMLMQQLRRAQEKFREKVRSTAPDFRPVFKPGHIHPKAEHRVKMDFLASEEIEVFDSGKTIWLQEVKEMTNEARTRELPGYIPFSVTNGLIKEATKDWIMHALAYFDEARAAIHKHLLKLIQHHFDQYKSENLASKVQSILLAMLQHKGVHTRDYIDFEFKKEQYAFTLNAKYLEDYRTKFHSRYQARWLADKSDRNVALNALTNAIEDKSCSESGIGSILAGLKKVGVNVEKPDLIRLLPKDDYEDSLEIMAQVRAYFHVSSKRFIDNVPLAVDQEFVIAIGRDIQSVLNNALIGDDARERCKEFLGEAPSMTASRNRLKEKLGRLTRAKEEMLGV